MRDRLSNMIQDAVGGCAKHWADIIADKLLAEGVIVAPCKVEQTVYRMNMFNTAYREAVVVAIYYAEDKKYYPKPHILVKHPDAKGRIRIDFREIGKTVFLTREEAERALKGAGDEQR